MPDILLHLLPHVVSSLLYAALGIHFWHTRWREKERSLVTLPMQPWERAAIVVALLIQGFGLYQGVFGGSGMRFSFSYALSLMLWLAVLIYWLESFRSRMDG
ncbi:MAG TPA: cytochrome C biogenesis protein, partial [Candidatus Accumulibacter sp.]|nr:cytochrome C biogenesis protein [Accumulibacter sp.]